MANTVGTVEYEVKVDNKTMTSSLASAGKKITSWGNKIGNVVSGLLGFAMFSSAKKGWEDLQSSLRQVNALEQGKANIEALTDEANKMAETFGNDASESVNAFYQAVSAGFSDDASLKLTTIANKLAAAATAAGEMTDAKGAINALTTVMNAYGLSADQAGSASDALVNTVNFGKTSINELAASIAQVAPVASAMGLSLEDTLQPIAALTQGGSSTAQAVTGIKALINEMASSSTDAGQALQDNLGMGLAEALEQGMSLTDVLQNGLLPSVDGNSQGFINLFSNIRAATAAMGLANNDFALASKVSDGFAKSLNSTDKATQAYTSSSLTRFHAGLNKVKDTIVGMIDSVGGLGNAITILASIFAAFKVASFIAKIWEAVAANSALAVAKTAAQTGVGSIAAVPATVAAIGAGIAAVGAIGGAITAGIAFSGGSSSSSGGGSTPNTSGTSAVGTTSIVVNVTPDGTGVSSNAPGTQVQTNYGGS